MHAFPHHYAVTASAEPTNDIQLASDGLPVLRSAAPSQFDGPGDRWSPESLLVAAVADCFVLTFRAIARAARLSWMSLDCRVTGTLDRVDRVSQFTEFEVIARLKVPRGVELEQALRALEKAKRECLISNSLKASFHLDSHIEVADPPVLRAAG
jgi:organic hydroperoxide reductase OsmC/OhrA